MSRNNKLLSGSTSEQEARAKATLSADPTAPPSISWHLPPDLAAQWSHAKPGFSLLGCDLRPSTMVDNVRAAIFPHLQQQVQTSIALSMSKTAWKQVVKEEETHKWKCGPTKPILKYVQPVVEEGHETRNTIQDRHAQQQQQQTSPPSSSSAASSSSPSSSSTSSDSQQQQAPPFQIPPITRTESFLSRLWSGNLLPFNTSFAAPKAASVAPMSDPSGIQVIAANDRPRFLSTERWIVQRCDGVKVYRVQYFGQGDYFYAQVVPTSVGGLVTSAYVKAKQWIFDL